MKKIRLIIISVVMVILAGCQNPAMAVMDVQRDVCPSGKARLENDQLICVPLSKEEEEKEAAATTPVAEAAATTPVAEAVEPQSQEHWFDATVWRNDIGTLDERYSVLFDPLQGGSADHPAYGWYYQPRLPSPDQREAHEVALVLRGPAKYRYTGPECSVYWNKDGSEKMKFDSGILLVDRQNITSGLVLQPTEGKDHEVWLFVKCGEGAGSGFSFEALEPLP